MLTGWRQAAAALFGAASVLFLAVLLWGVFEPAAARYPLAQQGSVPVLREKIQRLGAAPAYADFSCTHKNEPDLTTHPLAHAFGAALYLEKGIEAVGVCDDKFEYGCLHEFFGRAIKDHGISIAGTLDDECRTSFKGDDVMKCEHGIGHGVLTYLGYEHADLLRSLDICRALKGDAAACDSGVFMEYFNRTMVGGQARSVGMSAQQLIAECNAVPLEDRPGCVFELPRQWRKSAFPLAATTTEARTAIGSWCENYRADASLYRSCAEGMGNDLYLLTQGDRALAVDLCSESARSTEALGYCSGQIARLISLYERSRKNDMSCVRIAD